MVAAKLLLLGFLAVAVNAQVCEDTEMVYNGDFADPKIQSPWTIVNSIPGGSGKWTTLPPTNGFEIWQQGANNCPDEDSTGGMTGQHLQVNGNNDWAQVSYQFNVPCMLGSTEATYSFEYWFKPYYVVNQFQYTIEQEGCNIVDVTYPMNNKGWTKATGTFNLKACQPLKVTFTSDAENNGGVHINLVSLKLKTCSGYELVHGGDFAYPQITKSWELVQTLSYNVKVSVSVSAGAWMNTAGSAGFVLYKQGALGLPIEGAYGKPIGQSLELNGLSTHPKIGYKFFVPTMLSKASASISFQYFVRDITSVDYFGYTVEQNGHVIYTKSLAAAASSSSSSTCAVSAEKWTIENYSASLIAGQEAYIYFSATTTKVGGIHLAQVSVKTSESH
eukprot:TRINITY_DN1611_c1_g2_i1.p1 TRINITY_DN1611_c1_g2~~TRINITY_DN1611_c1_g2_i1.p1  ORF type:complete len:416 (-),score=35.64 TRINITY_DN1611_c1_g2_i1:381-1547(-)